MYIQTNLRVHIANIDAIGTGTIILRAVLFLLLLSSVISSF